MKGKLPYKEFSWNMENENISELNKLIRYKILISLRVTKMVWAFT